MVITIVWVKGGRNQIKALAVWTKKVIRNEDRKKGFGNLQSV